MRGHFTESVVEETALEWFGALGCQIVFRPRNAHEVMDP
jgi:hypothetical protein